jgi:hypothetical protein
MANEREEALQAVVPGPPVGPPKLDAAISDAASEAERTKQLELSHKHAMNMRRAELGWFGIVFGGEAHASIVVAFVVVLLGFAGAIGLWAIAYFTGKSEFWSSEAHVSLAAATSALGYVFGRGSKDNPKS